jgi:hypothetical protein
LKWSSPFHRRCAEGLRLIKRQVLPLAALTYMVASACVSRIDLDYLKDGACPAGEKLCNDGCVSTQRPEFGCSDPMSCSPCGLQNASARCNADGSCAVAACLGTHQDCDGDPTNGCEIDIRHDPQHCGDCLAPPCVVANATPDCAAGRCAIRSCNDGFEDCDEDAHNGCEVDLTTSPLHCGSCTTACPQGHVCSSGTCQ